MEWFVLFFMAGTAVGALGGFIRVWMWFSGQEIQKVIRALKSLASGPKIFRILNGLFFGTVLKQKLRSRDRIVGTLKVVFILCYLGIIIAYHIKAESIREIQGAPFYIIFFYAPFADFFFFRDITPNTFGLIDAGYALLNDTFASAILLFDGFLMYRRFVLKKIHLQLMAQDVFCYLIVGMWFVFRFAGEAASILAAAVPSKIAQYWFVGYGCSLILGTLNVKWAGSETILWSLSGLLLATLVASLPFTKLWHLLIAPIQIVRRYVVSEGDQLPFGRALSTPFDLKLLLEAESFDVKIGARQIHDLDWKQRISLDSCMACGRCQDVCPAYAAGRELSPSEVTIALEKAFKDTMLSRLLKRRQVALLDDRIKENTIWACTTCGACTSACPVDICPPEFLIEFRRALVEEKKLDKSKIDVLSNIGEKSNPYGLPIGERSAWAKGLEVKTLKEDPDVEYLYWVGCASSYDDRSQNIAKSIVTILQKADVRFGILGTEEKCCGELARRMGDEGRFQELAMTNIETLCRYNVKKIIVSCPHGFNTFKNEYPRFGGQFEVVHHSEFLMRLVKEGRIQLGSQLIREACFHDPCYLGRYNGIYDAPRQILNNIPGLKLTELPRTARNSFCCGGGGGNSFYEAPEKERMSVLRMREVRDLGVNIVAVACPFCISTLEDAAKGLGLQDAVSVKDVAELVSASMIPQRRAS